jgi:ethanolaminephosphotransferase
MIGLYCNLSLCLLTIYYGGLDNMSRLPSWVLHYVSIAYFSYYMLDNLDGKQARRTGSSSVLGMILDHSCDALTTFLFTIGLSSCVGCQTPFQYLTLWSMTTIPFYICTLEAYYIRELKFGMINGASEGTIFACGFITATAILGSNKN